MTQHATHDAQSLLAAVAEVATRAGQIAHSFFGRRIDDETKGDGSPVTVADRSAEQTARAWIEARYPTDGIAGEEFGELRPDAQRRWIIDPIDGTKGFVRGVPLWGTLVAIREGDQTIAGAAYYPALNETLAAALGEGCWWNGARCHVSPVGSIGESLVLTTDPRFLAAPARRADWERLSAASAQSRSWGDCYGYLLVATGRAEVMVDATMADWDSAAFYPAIVEAGGAFTDWSGKATAFGGSAVATNRAVGAEARALLATPAG